MGNFWKVNQKSTDGAIRYWDLIETMLAAGWTMPNAGDGLAAYGANQVTHGGSGANGLGNTAAWARLQDPNEGREFIFQFGPTASRWTLVYSKADKFTTGGAAATRPTSTDEFVLYNNANGTYLHPITNSVHHCWASNVAPYPFYLAVYPVTGGDLVHITMMDEIQQACPGFDLDPVFIIRGGATSLYSSLATLGTQNTPEEHNSTVSTLSAFGWTTDKVGLDMNFFMGTTGINRYGYRNTNMPAGLDNIQDTLSPGLLIRRVGFTYAALKGYSTNFLCAGRLRYSSDTYTVSSLRDKIYFSMFAGAIALPWNGEVPET